MPFAIGGDDELIQRALIRLCVRKGSFAADPALGSELYRLRGGPFRERLALGYAQEALLPMREVRVLAAECETVSADRLRLSVTLELPEKQAELEVEIS